MMMIQDKEIILHLNNKCTSSGKGPSQVGIAERDRKHQMTAAVDFSNSGNSEEDITQQINEALNLTTCHTKTAVSSPQRREDHIEEENG